MTSKGQARPAHDSPGITHRDSGQESEHHARTVLLSEALRHGQPPGTSRPGARATDAGVRHLDVPPIHSVLGTDEGTQLNPKLSVKELIAEGKLKADYTPPAKTAGITEKAPIDDRHRVARISKETDRSQPPEKIRVVYSDTTASNIPKGSQANFRVKADGTIVVLKDPDKTNGKEIVVEIAREKGRIKGPTAPQQKSLDSLVNYLVARLMPLKPDGTRDGIIDDPQGLVSDKTKAVARTQPAPEDALPEPVRHRVEQANRIADGSQVTPSEANEYVPPVPRLANETELHQAAKRMVAGLFGDGDPKPYDALEDRGTEGCGVGPYGLTDNMAESWLADLLGSPPDLSRLDERLNELVAEHKISAATAAMIKSQAFKEFLAELRHGKHPTKDDLRKFMPKELQEVIAGALVTRFGKATKDANGNLNPGKLALSMYLGHVPTEAEYAKPENRSIMSAGERLFSIAVAQAAGPGCTIAFGDVNNRLLAAARNSVGQEIWRQSGYSAATLDYGNEGCAASESVVFEKAGLGGFHTDNVGVFVQQIKDHGGFQVSASQAQPGDVVIFGDEQHIGLLGPNGSVYHNSSALRHWSQMSLADVASYRGFHGQIAFWHVPSSV